MLQERLRRVEGELEDGQEERSEKYAELRSKEETIAGHNRWICMQPHYVHICTITLGTSSKLGPL